MRHAVLGAGGIGGLVGGALAKAGLPVTLLVRPGRQDHYPERLTIESETLGSFKAPVRVADRLDGQFDLVWITVKATALEAALRAVAPEKLGDWVVVPLLNGIDHVERLRDHYGDYTSRSRADGIWAGSASLCVRGRASLTEPGNTGTGGGLVRGAAHRRCNLRSAR
jgi:ketopantoate reductase